MASKPNGHALALAEAFQGMIHDTVKPMVDGLRSDVQGQLTELRQDVRVQLETTNQNVQAQLSQHRKDIAADFEKVLHSSR